MKDYVRGAFQALSWAKELFAKVKDMAQLAAAITEVDKALEILKKAAAEAFLADVEAELARPESL